MSFRANRERTDGRPHHERRNRDLWSNLLAYITGIRGRTRIRCRKLVIRKEKHGIYTIKPCGYTLSDTTVNCYNRGMRLEFLEEEVATKIQAYKQRLEIELQRPCIYLTQGA